MGFSTILRRAAILACISLAAAVSLYLAGYTGAGAEAATASPQTIVITGEWSAFNGALMIATPRKGDIIRWSQTPTSPTYVLEVKDIVEDESYKSKFRNEMGAQRPYSDYFFVDENNDGRPD